MREINRDDERRFHELANKVAGGFRPTKKQMDYWVKFYIGVFFSEYVERSQIDRIVASGNILKKFLRGVERGV